MPDWQSPLYQPTLAVGVPCARSPRCEMRVSSRPVIIVLVCISGYSCTTGKGSNRDLHFGLPALVHCTPSRRLLILQGQSLFREPPLGSARCQFRRRALLRHVVAALPFRGGHCSTW